MAGGDWIPAAQRIAEGVRGVGGGLSSRAEFVVASGAPVSVAPRERLARQGELAFVPMRSEVAILQGTAAHPARSAERQGDAPTFGLHADLASFSTLLSVRFEDPV